MCTHMNMYTHTYYTLGRHPHAYTPFLLSFLSLFHSLFSFLFPSFLLLLTEWFFYIAQADSKLLILQLHPTTTSVCSPGTSHKPVIPFSVCNSNCFPLENQKTEEKLDHPTAAFFPLGRMILRFSHWVKWTLLTRVLSYFWTSASSQTQNQPSASQGPALGPRSWVFFLGT